MSRTYSVDYNAVRRVAREEVAESRSSSPAGVVSEDGPSSPASTISDVSSEGVGSPPASAPLKEAFEELRKGVYTVENAVHPELKSFYTRISTPDSAPLSEEEKSSHYAALVESVIVNKADISMPESYKTLPASTEALEFLRSNSDLPNENRNIGALAAKAAILLSEGKPNNLMVEELERDVASYQAQISRSSSVDYNRAPLFISKGEEIVPVRVPEGSSPGDYKRILSEKNAEHGFGLTGEQMDYIIASADQAGVLSVGQNFGMMGARNQGFHSVQIPAYRGSGTVVDITGAGVKLQYFQERDMLPWMDLENSAGRSIHTVAVDISTLTGDSLKFGLASGEVRITSSTTMLTDQRIKLDVPEQVRANVEDGFDHVREFAGLKMKTASRGDVDTPDKCAAFIASHHPKLTKALIDGASDVLGYGAPGMRQRVNGVRSESLFEEISGARPAKSTNDIAKTLVQFGKEAKMPMEEVAEIGMHLAARLSEGKPHAPEFVREIMHNLIHESVSQSAHVVEQLREKEAQPVSRRFTEDDKAETKASRKKAQKFTNNIAKRGVKILQEKCGMSKDEASRVLSRDYFVSTPEVKSHGMALRKAFESIPVRNISPKARSRSSKGTELSI